MHVPPDVVKRECVMQGSDTQRNVRSSMSDPDMFLNYTPTSTVSDVGKHTRQAFPDSVHIPEGQCGHLDAVNLHNAQVSL